MLLVVCAVDYTCYSLFAVCQPIVLEAGFFNICSWLSQKFGSDAASGIFFGCLTAYTKFGLNLAYLHCVAFCSSTF